MTTLTNPKVFRQALECTRCERNEELCRCANGGHLAVKNYRYFFPDLHDQIKLVRDANSEAHASIKQLFIYHSPDGFEWGYIGSGPADLALNILACFVPAPEAYRLHNRYMHDVISKLNKSTAGFGGDIVLDALDIRAWISKQWKQEASIPSPYR